MTRAQKLYNFCVIAIAAIMIVAINWRVWDTTGAPRMVALLLSVVLAVGTSEFLHAPSKKEG